MIEQLEELKNTSREDSKLVADKFISILVETGLFQKFEKENRSYAKYSNEDCWSNAIFHYCDHNNEDWRNWEEWIAKVTQYVKERVLELTADDIHYIATKKGRSWNGDFDGSYMEEIVDPALPQYIRVAPTETGIMLIKKSILDKAIDLVVDKKEVARLQRNRILDGFEEDYSEYYHEVVYPALKEAFVGIPECRYVNATDYIVDYVLDKYIPTGFYAELNNGMIFFFHCGDDDIYYCAESMLDAGDFQSWRSFDGQKISDTSLRLLSKIGLGTFSILEANRTKKDAGYGVTEQEEILYDQILESLKTK
jgi:hypothetical protein